jgi:hypothetical protein
MQHVVLSTTCFFVLLVKSAARGSRLSFDDAAARAQRRHSERAPAFDNGDDMAVEQDNVYDYDDSATGGSATAADYSSAATTTARLGSSSSDDTAAAPAAPAAAAAVKAPGRSRFAALRTANDITVSAATAAALAKGGVSSSLIGVSTPADVAATYVPNLDFDGPRYTFGNTDGAAAEVRL